MISSRSVLIQELNRKRIIKRNHNSQSLIDKMKIIRSINCARVFDRGKGRWQNVGRVIVNVYVINVYMIIGSFARASALHHCTYRQTDKQ